MPYVLTKSVWSSRSSELRRYAGVAAVAFASIGSAAASVLLMLG